MKSPGCTHIPTCCMHEILSGGGGCGLGGGGGRGVSRSGGGVGGGSGGWGVIYGCVSDGEQLLDAGVHSRCVHVCMSLVGVRGRYATGWQRFWPSGWN